MKRDVILTLDGVGDETNLTTHDVSAILNCDSSKAAAMLSEGTIPGAFRVGNRLQIQAADLRTWIKSEKLPKNPEIARMRDYGRRGAGGV